MEYCLETQALCKTYGRFRAVDNLSMHVPRGAIYGFVGKNGAGKTIVVDYGGANVAKPCTSVICAPPSSAKP